MEQNDLMESGSDIEVIESDPTEVLNDLCRVCGKSNDQMIPIFGLHEHQLADKINKYLPITVAEKDALPLHACITCSVGIIQWHTLTELCIRVNHKLLRMLREKHQVEQQHVDHINPQAEVGVHQAVQKLRSKKVQPQDNWPFSLNGENRCISRNNCSGGPSTSQQSQLPGNDYPAITSPIYENISEDESDDDNVASNKPLDMSVNPTDYSNDVEISNDVPERPAEIGGQITKLSKIQKIKVLLKKAQIKIQGKTFYHCRKCMRNFSSYLDYVYHVKSHNRPKVVGHECNSCGKQFHAKPQLIRHMSKHHSKVKRCEQCRKVCESSKRMNIAEPDSTTERYLCNFCKNRKNNQVVYTSATIFSSIPTSDEDCPKQCNHCKHFFPTESSLRLHISERTCMRVKNALHRTTK